jgi:hypothetical protein
MQSACRLSWCDPKNPARRRAAPNLKRLDASCGDEEVNVIVETPKGSRNKYDYDPEE